MADAAREERTFTAEEFVKWNLAQEERYELVDGQAIRMMAGARRGHRRCVTNVFRILLDQLDGGPCEPTTHDAAIKTGARGTRYADITVECDGDEFNPQELFAIHPRMVVEVLSPTTRYIDQTKTLNEYKSLPDLTCIVIVDPEVVFVEVHLRTGGAWQETLHTTMNAVVDIAEPEIRLPLTKIYRGLEPSPPLKVID